MKQDFSTLYPLILGGEFHDTPPRKIAVSLNHLFSRTMPELPPPPKLLLLGCLYYSTYFISITYLQ